MSVVIQSDESGLNEVAKGILKDMFSPEFEREWKQSKIQINTPRIRGLRRTQGPFHYDHTDALILRRFKTEVCLEDYFKEKSPVNPQNSTKLQGSSPRVYPTFISRQKSKILTRLERSLTEETEQTFGTNFCGRSVSTYPHIPLDEKRLGDPICDHWVANIYSNKVILAVADGCGWGQSAQAAAIVASNAAVHYLSDLEMSDVLTAAHYLLRSLYVADKAIRKGKSNEWECGTTTMIVGLVTQIQSKYMFVAASVGDCKVYHYRASERAFFDLTFNNREISPDPSDPGGRLGPFGEEGAPDLRNLDIYSASCERGDIIICVSDGIHDNLDPELLGLTPRDLFIDADSWADVAPSGSVSHLKSKFSQRLMKLLLLQNEEKLTVRHCVNLLINHAQNVTRKTREWVFANPQAKLPTVYRTFPGKLDHTTCVAFEVGASYEGISQMFQNTQNQLSILHKELRENFMREQVKLERQYFSLNIPIQVSMGCTDSHIKVFCRTVSHGELSVVVDETRLYIKVIGCPSLKELVSEEEFEEMILLEGDELSYPVERTVELPFPVDPNPTATTITYNEETGLLRVEMKRKLSFPAKLPTIQLSSSSGRTLLSPTTKSLSKSH